MDDLAPAATERTSGDGGRVREEVLTARKKAAKKAPPAPPQTSQAQTVPAIEPGAEHELDILA